jgi:hypothetical protein
MHIQQFNAKSRIIHSSKNLQVRIFQKVIHHTQKKIALNLRKKKFLPEICATCAQKYMEEKNNLSLFVHSTQFFVSVHKESPQKEMTSKRKSLQIKFITSSSLQTIHLEQFTAVQFTVRKLTIKQLTVENIQNKTNLLQTSLSQIIHRREIYH